MFQKQKKKTLAGKWCCIVFIKQKKILRTIVWFSRLRSYTHIQYTNVLYRVFFYSVLRACAQRLSIFQNKIYFPWNFQTFTQNAFHGIFRGKVNCVERKRKMGFFFRFLNIVYLSIYFMYLFMCVVIGNELFIHLHLYKEIWYNHLLHVTGDACWLEQFIILIFRYVRSKHIIYKMCDINVHTYYRFSVL